MNSDYTLLFFAWKKLSDFFFVLLILSVGTEMIGNQRENLIDEQKKRSFFGILLTQSKLIQTKEDKLTKNKNRDQTEKPNCLMQKSSTKDGGKKRERRE